MDVSKKNERLFAGGSFIGWLVLNMVNERYLVPYIFLQILNHILFMGLAVFLFRGDREKKILAAFMVMIVKTLVLDFCGSLLSCFSLFWKHMVQKIPVPVLGGWESSVIECVSFGMVILAVYWTAAHVSAVFYGKSRKWYMILAAPLLVFVIVADVAGWGASNGIMVRSGGNMGVYFDQIVSYAGFGILSALSMFAAGIYIFGMEQIYLEQKKCSQYDSQIAVYKMLQEQYRQSERLRHDMKNHMIALLGLLQNKEWEKMGEYLHHMEDSGLTDGGDVTGNKAVDALLYQKRKQAQMEHAAWDCDVQIPKGCGIQEFDLCILFGNILDNALEACERLSGGERPYVDIRGKAVKGCFFIEAKNSMDQKEIYQAGFTNKKNSWEHGIGLLNVRDVVQRYHGVVEIEAEGGMFVISILIPMQAAAHDRKQTV